MQRSKYVAILVLAVVVVGLLAAQYSLNNPTEATEALTAGSQIDAPTDPNNETASPGSEVEPASSEVAIPVPPQLGAAPPLTGIDGWLQTDATSLDSFSGQVTIVQFWTYSCPNCKATIPHLQDIYARHRPQGLEIVGVHAPEFDYERNPDNVAAAAAELRVTWPIALDTNKTSFGAWQKDRRFWPRTYVLDQNGDIRFDHIGEGNYDELAATVDYLIENGP